MNASPIIQVTLSLTESWKNKVQMLEDRHQDFVGSNVKFKQLAHYDPYGHQREPDCPCIVNRTYWLGSLTNASYDHAR